MYDTQFFQYCKYMWVVDWWRKKSVQSVEWCKLRYKSQKWWGNNISLSVRGFVWLLLTIFTEFIRVFHQNKILALDVLLFTIVDHWPKLLRNIFSRFLDRDTLLPSPPVAKMVPLYWLHSTAWGLVSRSRKIPKKILCVIYPRDQLWEKAEEWILKFCSGETP